VLALAMLDRNDESRAIRDAIEPQLRTSPSPYAQDLIARFAGR
jgi:hypothetical protein